MRYVLKFSEWQIGHHWFNPANIPVLTIKQAEQILNALACAAGSSDSCTASVYHYKTGKLRKTYHVSFETVYQIVGCYNEPIAIPLQTVVDPASVCDD